MHLFWNVILLLSFPSFSLSSVKAQALYISPCSQRCSSSQPLHLQWQVRLLRWLAWYFSRATSCNLFDGYNSYAQYFNKKKTHFLHPWLTTLNWLTIRMHKSWFCVCVPLFIRALAAAYTCVVSVPLLCLFFQLYLIIHMDSIVM